jgi:hypothetical protein
MRLTQAAPAQTPQAKPFSSPAAECLYEHFISHNEIENEHLNRCKAAGVRSITADPALRPISSPSSIGQKDFRIPPCFQGSLSAPSSRPSSPFCSSPWLPGLLAVRQMNAIYTSASEIQKSWLPSVRVLGDLRAGVITYRNVIREHMLSELLEEKLAQEKTLETVVEANTNARQTL